MKDLKDILSGVDAECVLEVGCGAGGFLKQLMSAMPDTKMLVGVDVIDPKTTVDPELLNNPKCERVTAAGHDLPFPDDSFDFVSIAHVLHHLDPSTVDATLAEMKRVLFPGGTFLIYEMYHDNQTDAQMAHVFYHHWISEIDRLCGVHHYPTFTREALTGIVDSLGLSDLTLVDYNEVLTAEEENEKITSTLDKLVKRLEEVKDRPEYERLKQEAQSINIWILTNGIAPPTKLIALGKTG